WWTAWLRDRHLPFLWKRLAGPEPWGAPSRASAPPGSFRYRSIAPAFSVYGYDVTLDRPVREFLDLSDVSEGGLKVQGSGTATIATAARYRPGRDYRVSGTGTGDLSARADRLGRLRFTVDLGPAHQFEQYSAPQRL